jgi:hypothetical protein
MLFALIPSLVVTATSLSSYSMNIVNTVYGSVIPQQGEGPIPQQGEGPIPQQGEGPIPQQGEGTIGEGPIPQQGEGTIGEGPIPQQGEGTIGEGPIPQQGEGIIGQVQNNSSVLENSSIGNELPEFNGNLTLTTIGCTPGYGYDSNSPNPICVPLDGSEKPEGVITCSALGCPYNPPNPNTGQPIGSGDSITK